MGKKVGKCCNPFKDGKHKKFCVVYHVTPKNIISAHERHVKIQLNEPICYLCRHKLTNPLRDASGSMGPSTSEPAGIMEMVAGDDVFDLNETIGEPSASSSNETDSDDDLEPGNIDVNEVKNTLNLLLIKMNVGPINESKLRGKKYQTEIIRKLNTRLAAVLLHDAQPSYDAEKIIDQLKEKFDQTTSRSLKTKILSILPRDWNATKIRQVFGESASFWIIKQTKKLVKKSGVLCDTTKRIASHTIDQNTFERVQEFYRNDNVSRSCPGIREYVRCNTDGNYEKVQRRLILMNLNEAFQIFKEENPGHKIGFSKFASIRPKECVLAGSTHGIHTTCVCVYHQNVKLIFDSLKNQFNLSGEKIETYRDMLDILLCDEITEKCRLNECKLCPGIDGRDGEGGLRSILFRIIDDMLFENVSFKQWISVGSKC